MDIKPSAIEHVLTTQRQMRAQGKHPKLLRVSPEFGRVLMEEIEALVIEYRNGDGEPVLALAGMLIVCDERLDGAVLTTREGMDA